MMSADGKRIGVLFYLRVQFFPNPPVPPCIDTDMFEVWFFPPRNKQGTWTNPLTIIINPHYLQF